MTAPDTKHFLDLHAIDASELRLILNDARTRKEARAGQPNGVKDSDQPLAGCLLAMIFEKPSTRTRVSFDVGMRQLGGETIFLSGSDMQLGRGESIADTARVLSRMVDLIQIRTSDHDKLLELAEYATVPIINGLTDFSHPCQLMADVLTFEEHKGSIKGKTVAWTGDGNNMLTSWVHAAGQFGFKLRAACPTELAPDATVQNWAQTNNVDFEWTTSPEEAVESADCVVTDTWVSMGDKDAASRHNLLKPYQVNEALMKQAQSDAIFMHCLPAHREEEVTAGVLDGEQSVIWDEAENRVHAQKAIMNWCLSAKS